MGKRTLIIHGSPRKNGDTAALLNELKNHLSGEVVELSAFYSGIAPCIDCRSCFQTGHCAIHDEMELIYQDGFDNVVLASPVYYMTLPGQVLSLISRFQALRGAGVAAGHPVKLRPKKAALILTAGGKGNEAGAEHHIRVFFKMMNASGFEEHTVKSVNTDAVPATEDTKALAEIRALAQWLEE